MQLNINAFFLPSKKTLASWKAFFEFATGELSKRYGSCEIAIGFDEKAAIFHIGVLDLIRRKGRAGRKFTIQDKPAV